MCLGSLYAMQQNLPKGYITLSGGHRVGVCGRCISENGSITHMSDISAICIRVSREIIGAADPIMEYIVHPQRLYNTLIISPAGCGKTTMLKIIAGLEKPDSGEVFLNGENITSYCPSAWRIPQGVYCR